MDINEFKDLVPKLNFDKDTSKELVVDAKTAAVVATLRPHEARIAAPRFAVSAETLHSKIGELRAECRRLDLDIAAAVERLREKNPALSKEEAERDPTVAPDIGKRDEKKGYAELTGSWEQWLSEASNAARKRGAEPELEVPGNAAAERANHWLEEAEKRASVARANPRADPRDLRQAAFAADLSMAYRGAAADLRSDFDRDRPLRIQLKRSEIPNTADTALWMIIRQASVRMGFDQFQAFVEQLLEAMRSGGSDDRLAAVKNTLPRTLFRDGDAYQFVKAAAEIFMMVQCGTFRAGGNGELEPQLVDDASLQYASRRGLTNGAIGSQARLEALGRPLEQTGHSSETTHFPYLALVRHKLGDSPLTAEGGRLNGILTEKLTHPCLVELLWAYWHEEAMLVQTMNALMRRFQNIRTPGARDPLAALEIDPLRPLNPLMWGLIQDQDKQLSVVRRAFEYDHEYGLTLMGKAIGEISSADSRTRFLEAFHNLLHACSEFYLQDDDTTVIADGFPLLNALRDVHLILSQGAHNQYGDLPWSARRDMLVQQWILARPETREFLPTRMMVVYPEEWMGPVEAMKALMGWGNTPVIHFSDLAKFGERIILAARFAAWLEENEPESAANWARFWRPEVQGYVHAYRAVTGVDLSQRVDATMPAALLKRRLEGPRATPR
jgi:hypothetical protein